MSALNKKSFQTRNHGLARLEFLSCGRCRRRGGAPPALQPLLTPTLPSTASSLSLAPPPRRLGGLEGWSWVGLEGLQGLEAGGQAEAGPGLEGGWRGSFNGNKRRRGSISAGPKLLDIRIKTDLLYYLCEHQPLAALHIFKSRHRRV